MAELKKKDLLAVLAEMDAAADALIEDVRTRNETHPGIQNLDRARFWPEAIRDAVNQVRRENGATQEELLAESARRISREFSRDVDGDEGWEVKDWFEVKRLETGERIFQVLLLGVDLPETGEDVIPSKARGGKLSPGEQTSDFCECGHTRGSHYEKDGWRCVIDGCECESFRLLASGIEGVEEPPSIPAAPEGLDADVAIERAAVRFWRAMEYEASLDQADPTTWMALQRLLHAGWRFLPPPEES